MSRPTIAAILVTGMLLTGCSNSLWSKFQDKQCVENCADPDISKRKHFEQPVWQTLNMFIGEACCMIVFHLIKWSHRHRQGTGPNKMGHHSQYNYSPVARSSSEQTPTQQGLHGIEQIVEDVPGDERTVISHSTGAFTEQLTHPSHVKIGAQAPILAAHGQTPAPLPVAIEPQLFSDQNEANVERLVGLQKMIFWLPTIFDICGTTLMNAGLLFVPVSIFQMIRGALPLWVALFSIVFLDRRLSREKWFSLMIITFGVALVGFAGSLQSTPKPDFSASADDGTQVVLGILLIFFAQLFTASQFVVEEKIMTRYEVAALEAVGLEGLFGLLTTILAIPILHLYVGSQPAYRGGYFDAWSGLHELLNSSALLLSSLAIAVSIALFNFCGLAVTKTISATVRSVIDTSRSIGIWVISLILGWECFSSLQLVGFIVLVLGTFLFNDIIIYPRWFISFIRFQPASERID